MQVPIHIRSYTYRKVTQVKKSTQFYTSETHSEIKYQMANAYIIKPHYMLI